VTVVAPRVGEAVLAFERRGEVRIERRPYASEDARGAFVIVGATDDETVNQQISNDARASGALVNIVDRPALCSFTVPAVVRRGALTLGVATDGTCPSFAAAVRASLERQYGPEYALALARIGSFASGGWRRDGIRAYRGGGQARVDAGLVEAVAAGDDTRVERLLADAEGEMTCRSAPTRA